MMYYCLIHAKLLTFFGHLLLPGPCSVVTDTTAFVFQYLFLYVVSINMTIVKDENGLVLVFAWRHCLFHDAVCK